MFTHFIKHEIDKYFGLKINIGINEIKDLIFNIY